VQRTESAEIADFVGWPSGPSPIHSLHFHRLTPRGFRDILELQRLTCLCGVGSRSGSTWPACSDIHRPLDAYSTNNFQGLRRLHKGKASLPVLLDLTHIVTSISPACGGARPSQTLSVRTSIRVLVVGNASVVPDHRSWEGARSFFILQARTSPGLGALTPPGSPHGECCAPDPGPGRRCGSELVRCSLAWLGDADLGAAPARSLMPQPRSQDSLHPVRCRKGPRRKSQAGPERLEAPAEAAAERDWVGAGTSNDAGVDQRRGDRPSWAATGF